jgi:hypothetical protein
MIFSKNTQVIIQKDTDFKITYFHVHALSLALFQKNTMMILGVAKVLQPVLEHNGLKYQNLGAMDIALCSGDDSWVIEKIESFKETDTLVILLLLLLRRK